jgi:hypothetical protein
MANDPTKDREFQRVLKKLLSAPPKPHSEMKAGKSKVKSKASPRQSKKGGPSK